MFRDSATSSTFDHAKPYVQRALQDDEIRRNVMRAWSAARKVYSELNGDGPLDAASKFSNDSHNVREDLDTTVQSLSEAIVRMSGKSPKKRSGWGPFFFIAAILLVLFNPATGADTRKWLKDSLLGSEEEFDYATPNY